jgi:8-oxo-dGTP diphosphatase
MWAPPSGFIESGETLEDACLRELKEETGMNGEVKKLIGAYLEKTEIYGDVIVIMYLVEISEGEMKAGDDVVDVRFFRREELPDLHLDCFRKAIGEVL